MSSTDDDKPNATRNKPDDEFAATVNATFVLVAVICTAYAVTVTLTSHAGEPVEGMRAAGRTITAFMAAMIFVQMMFFRHKRDKRR